MSDWSIFGFEYKDPTPEQEAERSALAKVRADYRWVKECEILSIEKLREIVADKPAEHDDEHCWKRHRQAQIVLEARERGYDPLAPKICQEGKKTMSYTLTFGKYKGQSIDDVFKKDMKYVYWLAEKSNNPVAAKSADAVIAKQRQQDDETDQQLVKALREINKQHSRPGLAPYKHVDIEVRDNIAEIDLCTHKIFTKFPGSVAINDDFHDADWDAMKIVMDHEDLHPYDEKEDKDAWKRTIPLGDVPKAEDTIWYPLDAQEHLLSSQAMTLEQCINFLDEFLLKRGINNA